MRTWGDLFTSRQALTLVELTMLVENAGKLIAKGNNPELTVPVQTCLAFVIDKMADKASSLCRWKASAEYMGGNTFGRQALPMLWDFCEASVLGKVIGDIASELEWIEKVRVSPARVLDMLA
jgi:adenine-specific DNA methylase